MLSQNQKKAARKARLKAAAALASSDVSLASSSPSGPPNVSIDTAPKSLIASPLPSETAKPSMSASASLAPTTPNPTAVTSAPGPSSDLNVPPATAIVKPKEDTPTTAVTTATTPPTVTTPEIAAKRRSQNAVVATTTPSTTEATTGVVEGDASIPAAKEKEKEKASSTTTTEPATASAPSTTATQKISESRRPKQATELSPTESTVTSNTTTGANTTVASTTEAATAAMANTTTAASTTVANTSDLTEDGAPKGKKLSQNQKKAARRARLKAEAANGNVSTTSNGNVSTTSASPSGPQVSKGAKQTPAPARSFNSAATYATLPQDEIKTLQLRGADARITPKPIPAEEVTKLVNLLETPRSFYIFRISSDYPTTHNLRNAWNLEKFSSTTTTLGQALAPLDFMLVNAISSSQDEPTKPLLEYLKRELESYYVMRGMKKDAYSFKRCETGEQTFSGAPIIVDVVAGPFATYDELMASLYDGEIINCKWFPDFRVFGKKTDIKAACRVNSTHTMRDMLTLSLGDVNICERQGITAVHLAAMYGDMDLAVAILAKASKVRKNWQAEDGKTPLHYAVTSGIEFVSLFVKALGSEIQLTKDGRGYTPKDIAEILKNYDVVRLLSGEVPTLQQIAIQSLVQSLSASSTTSLNLDALPKGLDVPSQVELHNYGALVQLAQHYPVNPVHLFKAMSAMEVWYGNLFSNGLSPFLSNIMYLIPVWQNLAAFAPQNLPPLGKVLLKRATIPQAPIAFEELFTRRLMSRTRHVLSSISWNNVMLIGGMALSCLVANDESHKTYFGNTDVDLFIVGLGGQAFRRKVSNLVQEIHAVCPASTVVRTAHSISIVSQNRSYPNFQVILAPYICPAHLLFTTDLDCTALGFDGKQLWATPRAREAIVRRQNVCRANKYDVRGEWRSESRLAKYAQRGFQVVDIELTPDAVFEASSQQLSVIKEACWMSATGYQEAVKMIRETSIHGAALLLLAGRMPELLRLLAFDQTDLVPGLSFEAILRMVSNSRASELAVDSAAARLWPASSEGVDELDDYNREWFKVPDVEVWGVPSFREDYPAEVENFHVRTCGPGGSRRRTEVKSMMEFPDGYGNARSMLLIVNPVYWAPDGSPYVADGKLPMKQRPRMGSALRGMEIPLQDAITILDGEKDRFEVRDWYEGVSPIYRPSLEPTLVAC